MSAAPRQTHKVFASYLPPHYSAEDVMALFATCETVVAVKLLPIPNASHLPLKYRCGFVHLPSSDAVDRAIRVLNNHHIVDAGKRYILTVRNASDQAPMNTTNLLIKNLSLTMDEQRLRLEFIRFGSITSVRVMRDGNGKPKSLAFVNFMHPGDALRAIQELHGTHLDGRRIHVSFAEKEYPYNVHIFDSDRGLSVFDSNFVKNISMDTNCDGNISDANIYQQHLLHSRFINNQHNSDCIPTTTTTTTSPLTSGSMMFTDSTRQFDGVFSEDIISSSQWLSSDHVTSKYKEITHAYENMYTTDCLDTFCYPQHYHHYNTELNSTNHLDIQHKDHSSNATIAAADSRTNVYVRNLSVSVGDERLKREFERFGPITSCKVMRHTNGVSKRIAFVNFMLPGSAQKALLSVVIIDGRQTYSSYAFNRFMNKEDNSTLSTSISVSSLTHIPLPLPPRMTPTIYRPTTPGITSLSTSGQSSPTSSSHPGSPTFMASCFSQRHPTPPLTPTTPASFGQNSLHDHYSSSQISSLTSNNSQNNMMHSNGPFFSSNNGYTFTVGGGTSRTQLGQRRYLSPLRIGTTLSTTIPSSLSSPLSSTTTPTSSAASAFTSMTSPTGSLFANTTTTNARADRRCSLNFASATFDPYASTLLNNDLSSALKYTTTNSHLNSIDHRHLDNNNCRHFYSQSMTIGHGDDIPISFTTSLSASTSALSSPSTTSTNPFRLPLDQLELLTLAPQQNHDTTTSLVSLPTSNFQCRHHRHFTLPTSIDTTSFWPLTSSSSTTRSAMVPLSTNDTTACSGCNMRDLLSYSSAPPMSSYPYSPFLDPTSPTTTHKNNNNTINNSNNNISITPTTTISTMGTTAVATTTTSTYQDIHDNAHIFNDLLNLVDEA